MDVHGSRMSGKLVLPPLTRDAKPGTLMAPFGSRCSNMIRNFPGPGVWDMPGIGTPTHQGYGLQWPVRGMGKEVDFYSNPRSIIAAFSYWRMFLP